MQPRNYAAEELAARNEFNQICHEALSGDRAALQARQVVNLQIGLETPVYRLAKEGKVDAVSLLVDHAYADIDQALLGLMEAGCFRAAEALLAQGASLAVAVNGALRYGLTFLPAGSLKCEIEKEIDQISRFHYDRDPIICKRISFELGQLISGYAYSANRAGIRELFRFCAENGLNSNDMGVHRLDASAVIGRHMQADWHHEQDIDDAIHPDEIKQNPIARFAARCYAEAGNDEGCNWLISKCLDSHDRSLMVNDVLLGYASAGNINQFKKLASEVEDIKDIFEAARGFARAGYFGIHGEINSEVIKTRAYQIYSYSISAKYFLWAYYLGWQYTSMLQGGHIQQAEQLLAEFKSDHAVLEYEDEITKAALIGLVSHKKMFDRLSHDVFADISQLAESGLLRAVRSPVTSFLKFTKAHEMREAVEKGLVAKKNCADMAGLRLLTMVEDGFLRRLLLDFISVDKRQLGRATKISELMQGYGLTFKQLLVWMSPAVRCLVFEGHQLVKAGKLIPDIFFKIMAEVTGLSETDSISLYFIMKRHHAYLLLRAQLDHYTSRYFSKHGERARSFKEACLKTATHDEMRKLVGEQLRLFNPGQKGRSNLSAKKHEQTLKNKDQDGYYEILVRADRRLNAFRT